ncbi:Lipoprotein releasing system transmembrane protein [Serratia symbiotica str. 'Cinara cedri']|nr:Lipoprotein releasing system transmembrane protein [Serratia symbiotica str. 'Cinara cedri']
MYQPIVLFIGLRYLRGRTSDCFGRFIAWLSTIGITVGVMAMVTVLSVMNGFERDLGDNILGLMPQALIINKQGSINPHELPVVTIQGLKGVSRVTSLTISNVILQSARNIALGVMLGINPDEPDPLTPYLVNITQQQLQPNHYNIIIGEQLANQLGVKRYDKLRLMVPSVGQFTPMGRIPSHRLFTIIGTFRAHSEVDSYQILVNQYDASRLMRYPVGNITGWRLFLHQPLKVDSYSKQMLPAGTEWKDWRERKGELFQAVHIEKTIMGLLLSFIVAVAAFNIITSLSLIVMKKQNEVAILQTQGLTRGQIVIVFIVQGASAGVIGSLIGALCGVLLAINLNNLMPSLGGLIINTSLPVSVDALQVTVIAIVSMIVSIISTLYPSWYASTIQPAKALHYE